MKKFLGFASAALLMSSVSAHAATWTWNVAATFYSYNVYGDTYDTSGNPQTQPKQEYVVTNPVGSVPPDGGTLSGSITFNASGQVIDWNLTTTGTTLPLTDPAFTNTPAYSGFPGSIYTTSTSTTGTGLYDNGASNDVWFISNDGNALDFIFPLLWGDTFNMIGQTQTADPAPTQEANFLCASDNYPGNWNFANCDYIGNFRLDSRGPEDDTVTSITYTLAAFTRDPQTDTPEPATLAILGTGLVALGLGRRRLASKA